MTKLLEHSTKVAGFSWATAQATGSAHIECDTPCQDALAVMTTIGADGHCWLVAAVADGAGSVPFADIGANYAARTFVAALAHSLAGEVDPCLTRHLVAAAALARFELELMAEIEGHEPRDYATTLLGCISNGTTSAFLQIGDGAIVIGPPWRVVLTPQRGEYVNESVFLTCPGGLGNAGLAMIEEPIGTIVLLTDGLEGLSIKSATLEPHTPFFDFVRDALMAAPSRDGIMEVSERLAALVESPTIRDRTDDDVTIIAIQSSANRCPAGDQP